jgi:hypothetical protein
MGFRRIETAKLYDWKGGLDHPELKLLLHAVAEIIGQPPNDLSTQGVLAMTTAKHLALTLALTFFALLANLQAQTPRMATVNITPDSHVVHISAVGDVSEMRIEVSDESGDVIFQSGAITGQQLDWKMTDTPGERVAAGTYLITVTYRNAAGKSRKRVEQVTVEEAEKSSTQHVAAPQAAQETVTTSNAGVFGTIARFTGASTIANSVITQSTTGKIGIGTSAPASKLTVNGGIQILGAGNGIKFADGSIQTKAIAGTINGTGTANRLAKFTGPNSFGNSSITEVSGNVGIGTSAPAKRLSIAGDAELGTSHGDYRHLRIGGGNSSGFIYGSYPKFGDGIHLGYNYYADAAGNDQIIHPDGGTSRISLGYGSIELAVQAAGSGEPVGRISIKNSGLVEIGRLDAGTIYLGATYGTGSEPVCTSAYGGGWLADCVSSARYKTEVRGYAAGLDLLNRLRPVSFRWKHDGRADLGLIAEEVAEVEPLLTSRNDKGEIRGVKYDRLSAIFVNAFKEQQAQIEQQALRNEEQARQIKRLQAQLNQVKRAIKRNRAAKRS